MSKKTKILVFAGVAVAALVGAFAFKANRDKHKPVEVETAAVERREIVETVIATGRIQPVTQVNISADVSAKITRLNVKEGDWVERGQLLLELDRERYQAEVESAEANLRASQAGANLAKENLEKTRKDFERIEQLHSQQLESQSSLDASKAAFEVERARHQSALDQVEQSRAALKQSRDALSKTTIYAPMAGTVSKLNKEVGEIALGSQFQEDVILELANLTGMEALVDVDENDIATLTLGDAATIEVDALPDTEFKGTVTEIANSAKVSAEGTADQKTEFEVKVAIESPGTRLRPGMTASAEIVTEVRPNAVGVPIQSVAVRTPAQLGLEGAGGEGAEHDPAERGDEDEDEAPAPPAGAPAKEEFVEVVFVVEDGVAHAKRVKTGIQSDTHIELLEGVAEGAQVVTGSYRAISRDLKEGTAVKVAAPGAGERKAG